jgi:hypothetical protein
MADFADFNYWHAIVAERSIELSQEEATAGTATISVETQADLVCSDISEWVEENPALFLRLVHQLRFADIDLLISYYLLHKSQTSMSTVFDRTQTYVGYRIREAAQRLTRIILGQNPYPNMATFEFVDNAREFRDPPELGQFSVDVTSPGFEHMFTSYGKPDEGFTPPPTDKKGLMSSDKKVGAQGRRKFTPEQAADRAKTKEEQRIAKELRAVEREGKSGKG